MLHIELEDGDQVVADIGHSGGVTALVVTEAAVISGADDGYVYVRDHDGRSIVPPAHLPEVTALAEVPGTDLVLIGTAGSAHALNLEDGRHAPVAELGDARITAACAWGAEVAIGCADGTVMALASTGGTRTLTTLDEPVAGVAAAGNGLVVTTTRGLVVGMAGDGTVAWTTPRAAGEVRGVAVHGEHVVIAGAGPSSGSGRIVLLDADGSEVVVAEVEAPVVALATDDEDLVAALEDGTVRTVSGVADGAPVLGQRIGAVESPGIESLALAPDGAVWCGTAGGDVVRIDEDAALPARSSGVLAMSFADDQATALAVDGQRVLHYDLVSGDVEEVVAIPGAVAVTHVPEDDFVVALRDGSLQRRRGPAGDEVLAAGPSGLLPNALGRGGGVVLAEDDDTYSTVDAVTLAPAEIADENFFRMLVARREGNGFVGEGPSSGLTVTVVQTSGFAAVRPGMASVTDDGREWFRVWRDGAWVAPA